MKKIFTLGLGVLMLAAALGLTASAQTTSPTSVEELQKQIQLLLGQISSLQKEVTALKPGVVAPATPITVPASPTTPTTINTPPTTPAIIDESEVNGTEAEFISPPTLTRSLFRGSRGEDVRQLQEFLSQDPTIYPEGLATGFYGAGTEAAVKRWQTKNGLPSVGVIGRQTISKFKEISSGVLGGLKQQSDRSDTIATRPADSCPAIFYTPVCKESQAPYNSQGCRVCQTKLDDSADKSKINICPALPTVDSCLAGEERVVTYKSAQCGVYYACKPKASTRADNTIATLKKVSAIQSDNRYNLILNDPEGIQKFSVYNSKGAEIHSGYPACHSDWTSPTIGAENSEFPLKLTLTDCGNPNSFFTTALTTPVVVKPISEGLSFPYKFSNGKSVYSSEEARSYCYANGPGSGQGLAGECETKFGVVYTTVTPIATTTTSTTSGRAYYLTAVFESCMTKYGFTADAKQIKVWAQAADAIPWQNLTSASQRAVSACELEYYGVPTPPTTTAMTTTQTTTATTPAGQKEQVWNSLGLKSWIRTDADTTKIEQLKSACVNVPTGANIWSPNAGLSTSVDFGMPSADKCQRASACTTSQYFDGAACVANTYQTTTTTTGDSCSQYGSGWHSMSVGLCFDSAMQNYRTTNGTLYSCSTTPTTGCSGTTTTTTSTGSCDSSLIALLGTGCHYMYNDTAGSQIFCDGPMSKSAKRGDAATTAGCQSPTNSTQTTTTTSTGSCSQYGSGWHTMGSDNSCFDTYMTNYRTANGTLYSCSATPAPGCSSSPSSTVCTNGQYWNGSACVSSTTTTTSTSCPSGQYWSGSACVNTSTTNCTSGQYWNGTSCVVNPSPTTTTCPSGQYWSGTACVNSPKPSASVYDQMRDQLRSMEIILRGLLGR